MSEETQIQEAIELAEQAQSKEKFSLIDAIKGKSFPEQEVIVFLDDKAALELMKLNDKMNRETDPELLKGLEDEAVKLAQAIKESSLRFRMRGVAQKAIEAVMEKCNERYEVKKGEDGTKNSLWLRDYITILVGMNVVSVTNSSGQVDEGPFDEEAVEEIRQSISATEWGKLVETMQKLTLAGGYFEQLTDAGFLQKS